MAANFQADTLLIASAFCEGKMRQARFISGGMLERPRPAIFGTRTNGKHRWNWNLFLG
jgi:hypothetical protein